MYPAPTMSSLPELVTGCIPVIVQGLPGVNRFLSPTQETYEPMDSLGSVRYYTLPLVIRELQELWAAVLAKRSGSISQGSESKSSLATVHCQLKKKITLSQMQKLLLIIN